MSLWNASQIFRLKRKPLDLKCTSNITNIRKRKTQSNLYGSTGFILVRTTGLEPAWTSAHKNLNLARLPIPPCPHFAGDFDTVQPPRAGVTIDVAQFCWIDEYTHFSAFALLCYSSVFGVQCQSIAPPLCQFVISNFRRVRQCVGHKSTILWMRNCVSLILIHSLRWGKQ